MTTPQFSSARGPAQGAARPGRRRRPNRTLWKTVLPRHSLRASQYPAGSLLAHKDGSSALEGRQGPQEHPDPRSFATTSAGSDGAYVGGTQPPSRTPAFRPPKPTNSSNCWAHIPQARQRPAGSQLAHANRSSRPASLWSSTALLHRHDPVCEPHTERRNPAARPGLAGRAPQTGALFAKDSLRRPHMALPRLQRECAMA